MRVDSVYMHAPSLRATLKQIAQVSAAIWRDYVAHKRQQRQARRLQAFSLPTVPSWRTDVCHLAVGVLALAAAAGIALFMGVA
jgi:hypothetical protein